MLFDFFMSSLLIICLVTDLKERKIYNYVLLPGFIGALIYHGLTTGLLGIGTSFLGMLVGLFILFIPFAMGGMGAGDVKLLSMIGSWKGALFVLKTALYMALIGGGLALIIILFQRGWRERFKGYLLFFIYLMSGKYHPEFIKTKISKLTYPYGVAIVIGAFCSLFLGVSK